MLTQAYIRYARHLFRLDWFGIHSVRHWARVRRIGQALSPVTVADFRVVECFAFVHDLERENENRDQEHGNHAACLADKLNDAFFGLSTSQLALLKIACRLHSGGTRETEPTIATCLDADRLDLGRVGIVPDPKRLCTAIAGQEEVIQWAWLLSASEPARRPKVLGGPGLLAPSYLSRLLNQV